MARNHLQIFISLLILLPLAFPFASAYDSPSTATVPPEKHTDVVVEGMVYCQSCNYYGTSSLTEARPLPAAKVSVICKSNKKQVSYYRAFETNQEGYFYGQLEGFNMNHALLEHPLQSCRVKLVSSPDQNCSSLSNVNDALNGAPLRYENKVIRGRNYEAVIYAAGPLAFRPSYCPKTHF